MNSISFCGGETSGSVGKRNLDVVRKNNIQIQTPQADTVNFRGRDDDESSAGSTIVTLLGAAALIIGGLGYAHKAGLVGKIKNAKVQDFAEKITKPCHNLCSKVKNFGTDCYDKIMKIFKK